MSAATPGYERLYALLPALYRMRDASSGEPLRALLSIMESQLQSLEDDIAGLYETWFIETCPEWAVPYIAELLDVRGLPPRRAVSSRAYVAHTVGYRRRKGTLSMLPALGRDITGWPLQVVEALPLLGRTQHLAQPQLGNLRTPLVRRRDSLGRAGEPLDSGQHTIDVRKKHLPSKLGFHIWRLLSLRASGAQAAPLPGLDTSSSQTLIFTFSPLGLSAPLFGAGLPPSEIASGAAGEASYPGPLRAAAVQAELATFELAKYQQGALPAAVYFGSQPAFRIVIERADRTRSVLEPADLVLCELREQLDRFALPPRALAGAPAYQAAIDVARGRFALPKSLVPAGARVLVDYNYGAPAALGGGNYARPPSPLSAAAAEGAELVSIRGGDLDPARNTIDQKLIELNLGASQAARTVILQLEDSLTYRVRIWSLPRNVRLELRAASGQRPVLSTPVERLDVRCQDGASLSFDGVLFVGSMNLSGADGAQLSLELHHSTVAPLGTPPNRIGALAAQTIQVTGNAAAVRITARRSVVSLALGAALNAEIDLTDCIVPQLSAGGASVRLRGCTVLDNLVARELTLATDSIFAAGVAVQSAEGVIQHCYLPPNLVGYNCQPALAIRDGIDPTLVTPVFSSTSYGQPGYARLALSSHPALRQGGSDGAELGVMHHTSGPQREAALRAALEDYLRLGQQAEFFYET